jgi:small GTP-binding protein
MGDRELLLYGPIITRVDRGNRVQVLNDALARLLHDEKTHLAKLYSTLGELRTPPADLEYVREALVRLDELFLIVVVGEFNSGKSALINALLGAKVLPEGVTPTTTRVTLVKYGENVQESQGADDFAELTFPLDFLRELNIVDTPGTNAVIRGHEELTRHFIPRSDLVLFVTSADRPFTESERLFLDHIRQWGKKVVLVINKRDILETEAAQTQVRAFVEENSRLLLGFAPEIFLVSAKREAQDGQMGNGMSALKSFVLSWLDETARLSVKFASPLGVADQVLERAQLRSQSERETLKADVGTAETIEREIDVYAQEMASELGPRLAEVDNILYRLETRGVDFFDQRIRLMNITELARGDRFRARFESQVLAGVPEEIENRSRAIAEWLVEKDLRHWQEVLSYLHRRRAGTSDQLVGELTTSIDLRRQALLNSVGESAQAVVASYDAEKESREIGAHVEAAVVQTALVEVGAVGLGTLVTTAVSAAALDVTGVVLAGVLAVVGLLIIPYRRQQAKARFKEKIDDLRKRLMAVIQAQFGAEADRSLTRLKEGVAPYLRFVRGERDRLAGDQEKLDVARTELAALRARVERVFSHETSN